MRPIIDRSPRPLAVSAWQSAQALQAPGATFDLLIRDGRILDGTGNPWLRVDIGIRGDRIVAMGRARGPLAAATVIDAEGPLRHPRLHRPHSHAGPPGSRPRLKQGRPLLAQASPRCSSTRTAAARWTLAAQRAALRGEGHRRQRRALRAARLGAPRRAEHVGSRPHAGGNGDDGGHHPPGMGPARSACRAASTTRPELLEDRRGDRAWPRSRRSSAASTRATSATRPTTPSASWRPSTR